MMTLDEMKTAVAGLLPEKIEYRKSVMAAQDYHLFIWHDTKQEINKREWLAVCALAEDMVIRSLDADARYVHWLRELGSAQNTHLMKERAAVSASYEVRLEALCRVKFPEKWGKE